MNRERTESTIFFLGNVRTVDFSTIIPEGFRGEIAILGDLTLGEEISSIPCSLWVQGNVFCRDIRVDGDFGCSGIVGALDITVAGDFYCNGNIFCRNISIAEGFKTQGKVCCEQQLYILGNFSCTGGEIICNEIYVNGNCDAMKAKISCRGEVDINEYVYGEETQIYCKKFFVQGDVYLDGNIEAKESIIIFSSAYIYGNIESPDIAIETAEIQGEIHSNAVNIRKIHHEGQLKVK